ncbi:DUF4870 domain-containing protein [Haloarcula salinisoli]|uniref:DUF4870 domain-containing protein n=1 Tax=Haloarcula salinisoli TaxID=2487746 RepID=A0A8J7YMQ0_9EURY|nr:DUF4870 domain-containing protein [Halomicroarcula salinisoli]MBX0304028.1 DUF4870 domain-containing protein [Halomicroarcula salinisoli]
MPASGGANTGGTNDDQIVAILLTLVFPGLGHYYVGAEERAIWWIIGIVCYYAISFILTFVLIGFLFFLLAPLVHVICIIDVMKMT